MVDIKDIPYEKPLPGKTIFRIDLLQCLASVLGKECLICRKYLYEVIAGNGNYAETFGHLYRRHKSIMSYVNDMLTYGDNARPSLDVCLEPLREKVREYQEEMQTRTANAGAKFLLVSHGYLYVCWDNTYPININLEGIKIC